MPNLHAMTSDNLNCRLSSLITSPLCTPGGKYGSKARDLLRLQPNTYMYLIEGFAGGLNISSYLISVGILKSQQCIATEIDWCVCNFFHQLIARPIDLISLLRNLEEIYGRGTPELFSSALKNLHNKNRLKAAASFYIHNQSVFGSIRTLKRVSNFAPIRTKTKGLRLPSINRLYAHAKRLRGIDLRHADYKHALKEATSLGDKAFLFLDAPYPHDEKEQPNYAGHDVTLYGFKFFHDSYAEEVAKIKDTTNIMITTSDIAFSRDAFSDFTLISKPVKYCVGNHKKGERRKATNELIALNYEPVGMMRTINELGWELL